MISLAPVWGLVLGIQLRARHLYLRVMSPKSICDHRDVSLVSTLVSEKR